MDVDLLSALCRWPSGNCSARSCHSGRYDQGFSPAAALPCRRGTLQKIVSTDHKSRSHGLRNTCNFQLLDFRISRSLTCTACIALCEQRYVSLLESSHAVEHRTRKNWNGHFSALFRARIVRCRNRTYTSMLRSERPKKMNREIEQSTFQNGGRACL